LEQKLHLMQLNFIHMTLFEYDFLFDLILFV
jgi:hypothetical protein